MRGSRGVGTWDPDDWKSMEKQKAVNFLRNTGLEPLEKLPMSGHHRTASDAPF